MTAWRIKDWERRFEVSQSARSLRDHPRYVPIPVNLTGEHFRVLMADRDGQAAFGAFIALVELAATLPCKGVLANDDGELTSRAMSAKTGIPVVDLDAAITFLSAPEIGWLRPIPLRALRELLSRAKSERSRRALGAHSALAAATEQKPEQENSAAAAPNASARKGFGSAAVADAHRDVHGILSRLWNNGTADELAENPNATVERVAFLADRIIREKVRRPHGFMRKGITEGWEIPQDWLERWYRVNGKPAQEPTP